MFIMKIETAVGLFVACVLIAFFYMTSRVGFFNLDKSKYAFYTVCFNDAFGLERKADVKMFGIKVGRVESLALKPESCRVWASIMVQKECFLYSNTTAMIKQDGLLGNKYLELIPGDPQKPLFDPSKDTIRVLGEAGSFDSLITEVKSTSDQFSQVASSMQDFCTNDNATLMRQALEQLGETSRTLALLAQSIQGLVARNEEVLQSTLQDTHNLIKSLTKDVPQAAQKCASASDHIESVVRKIDEGQGFIGQLVNDKSFQSNFNQTLCSVKNTLSALSNLVFVNDTHIESMLGPVEHTRFNDFKAYIDFRLYPTPEYFYLGGIVGRRSGIIEREWRAFKERGTDAIGFKHETIRKLDKWLWNLQFGRAPCPLGIRGGLFESTLGLGLDFAVPMPIDNLHWLTTFEAYDFRGRLRIDDHNPHLKWMNRLFFKNNIYFVFGVDDFISKHNRNAFLGAGIWLDNEDIYSFFSPFFACP